MATSSAILIFTSAADKQEARKLAKLLLDKRVAACVTLLPGAESHYWWKKKQAKGTESLLLIKTLKSKYREVESLLKSAHSYSVPEILSVKVEQGSRSYLKWLRGEILP